MLADLSVTNVKW